MADFLPFFQYGLPPAAAFYIAGGFVLDYDQGTVELHLSYPQSATLRSILISAPRWIAWLCLTIALLLLSQIWLPPLDAIHLAWAGLVPAVALSGAAAACATLTRREAVGFLAAGFWWVIDSIAPGMLNRNFYLFPLVHPLPGILPAIQIRNVLIVGVFLWFIALYLSNKREHWLRS